MAGDGSGIIPVLCPGGAYDRSPCGTGTSAKLAALHASGKLTPGQVWRQAGILDTVFEGRYDVLADGKILPSRIDAPLFASRLQTAGIPDPDLLVRTSGEMRVSNFLLWQISYAEIVIIKKFWPDFRRNDLIEAVREYQRRHRRFGAL